MIRTTHRLAMTALLTSLALTGCGGGEEEAAASPEPSASPAQTRLQEVFTQCRNESDPDRTLTLHDAGATLVIDTRNKGISVQGLACVLAGVDTPTSITAAMDRTTALMGVQDAEHDGLSYSWSYHPDNGVNMVIEDTQ